MLLLPCGEGFVIPQWWEPWKLGVEDVDKIAQEPVWTEGGLFVEVAALDIAAVGLLLAEGTELAVAVVLAGKLLVGDVVVAAIAEEPYVGFAAALEDGLER